MSPSAPFRRWFNKASKSSPTARSAAFAVGERSSPADSGSVRSPAVVRKPFNAIKSKHNVEHDTDVPTDGLKELCDAYKEVYATHVGTRFPQNPIRQLELAIKAVFGSWNAEKAIAYRHIEGMTEINGTAVNVQTMVFGNTGDDSGTGVAFTRNPSTGENKFYGEFLVNAQGEDVVAGIRTPQPASDMPKWKAPNNKTIGKDSYNQLQAIKKQLEKHYKDVQDIEYTIQQGKLYMLQTRNGKRTGAAAVKIACDMAKEKLITEKQAVLRVPAGALTQLLFPSFDPKAKKDVLTIGLNASPGAAVGKLAFSADEAVNRTLDGESVLLVRQETSPEDVEGMHKAAGILTSTGGRTSHAAVVAVGWGKCCVAGAGEIEINEKQRFIKVNGRKFTHKDTLSIDGSTGEVMVGSVPTQQPKVSGDFGKLMKWADKYRKLKVRTNADSPADAKRAREFGAEGIGLCRTEHMFFEGDRILAMREMILVEGEAVLETRTAPTFHGKAQDSWLVLPLGDPAYALSSGLGECEGIGHI